jgi:hypothetical protein
MPQQKQSAAPAAGRAAPAQGAWPPANYFFNLFPWLWPTADFREFHKYGSVALPAATATVVSFTVPNGRNGRITGLGMDFQANGGAAFTQDVLPYELTFAILVNNQPAFYDLASFNYLIGSVSVPFGLTGLLIKEAQTISLTVTNNAIAVGTQFVAAHFTGYFYGKQYEPAILGAQ